jgi:hypothetical protein
VFFYFEVIWQNELWCVYAEVTGTSAENNFQPEWPGRVAGNYEEPGEGVQGS